MANENLEVYLNDHLAGSVAAVELLEHLEDAHKDTPLARAMAEIRIEIEADRQELKSLMDRMDISESSTRKATAWLAGKFTELKLRWDDPGGGELRLFESLEALSLGIEGKRSLWLTLDAVAKSDPSLRLLEYDRLKSRAEEQRRRVETMRLDVANKTLASGTSSAATH